jgi:hypothetical protein
MNKSVDVNIGYSLGLVHVALPDDVIISSTVPSMSTLFFGVLRGRT